MTNITELRDCRAPYCKYKAPVCSYGYCGACCRKYHNFMNMGATATNHEAPSLSPIQYGFKIIEHGKSEKLVPSTQTSIVVTPVLGKIRSNHRSRLSG